ncbi:DUF6438 domain-containing protein [Seonamhaeicola sp.]|uniref:DUF6438 domain-containing protein n=1 Tax=Seonamhaeicola sp. TaxID=1912245 RepID=UPI0026271EC4|nr:DUF6438 domain-containing protein [Seonamhaeicola sp.]
MKYLTIIIMIMITFSSCSAGKKKPQSTPDKIVVSYSKGRCLGKCPVYDLHIYDSGRMVYNGLDNVSKKGIYKSTISLDTLKRITSLMRYVTPKEIGEIPGRDLPLTVLKVHDKKVVYQALRINGNLLDINTLIEGIVNNI